MLSEIKTKRNGCLFFRLPVHLFGLSYGGSVDLELETGSSNSGVCDMRGGPQRLGALGCDVKVQLKVVSDDP